MLDHHHRRRRHVDADLDHRRRHQDLRAAGGEIGHRLVLLAPSSSGRARGRRDRRSAAADARVAVPKRARPGRRPPTPRPAGRPNRPRAPLPTARSTAATTSSSRSSGTARGVDGLPSGRLLQQARGIEIAIGRHHQGARDRRRGHHQHVGGLALARPAPAADARRSDAARRSRRGARSRNATSSWNSAWVPTASAISPDSRGRPGSPCARRALVGARSAARAARPPPWRAAAIVARCWRARISVGASSAAWQPASSRGQHGEQRHHRLAAADIALQQAEHARFGRHIGLDLRQRARLRRREGEGQGGNRLALQAAAADDLAARPAGAGGRARRASANWLASNSSNASRWRAGVSSARSRSLSG